MTLQTATFQNVATESPMRKLRSTMSRWFGMNLDINRLAMLTALVFLLVGCTGMPTKVAPVANFKLDRYLGKWYEIARLDHSFERGLSKVTAEYSLRPDGSVRVVNRGYSEANKVWKEAEGKAVFVQGPDLGHLKVSFFGPFYGSYVVFDLDQEGYQVSMVSGPNTSYLWILARQPTVPDAVKQRLLAKAAAAGFDTNALIFPAH
jgi:apolipoprotein D and lipocalin family protein